MIRFLILIFLIPAIQSSIIEGFENVHSDHFDLNERPGLNSIQLAPAEMKLFSSYALRLVKNKCPSIDASKLFRIQSYISKRLSLLNPTQITPKDATFTNHVLQTMTNCSEAKTPAEGSTVKPTAKADQLVRTVLWASEPQPHPTLPQILAPPKNPYANHDAFYHQQPSTETRVFIYEEATAPPMPSAPEPETPPTPTQPIQGHIVIPIIDFDLSDWFSSLWQSVDSFFDNIFTFGPGPAPARLRARRSADGNEEDVARSKEAEKAQMDASSKPYIISRNIKPYLDGPYYPDNAFPTTTTTPTEAPKPKTGKQAFIDLFDEVCNIYCDCPVHSAGEFQIGMLQVLKFLFTDEKSVDAAAAHLVDEELIKDLKACGA